MNVLSRFMKAAPWCVVTGVIIVISASDKSLPRWVICANDREQERSLASKMKQWYTHANSCTNMHAQLRSTYKAYRIMRTGVMAMSHCKWTWSRMT